MMREFEKKAVKGQQRENKIQNIQNLNRLERDLERSAKQLKQEMQILIRKGENTEDNELLNQCEILFNETEEYMKQQEYEKMERLMRKDYTKVHSKIDSGVSSSTKANPQRQRTQRQSEVI